MYSKITLLSTIVAFVVFNILDYIIYGLLISDTLPSDPMTRDWSLHIIGTLVLSYVMTLIYLKLQNPLGVQSGLVFGFLIGLLFTVGQGLMLVGIGQMGLTEWVNDASIGIVLYCLVGGSIGFIASTLKK
ncbi:MAG: hypothetical protein OXE77_10840 [Flavobacteriaceae bacterium]|nr:hypothetical protein [Flavobacteriaceae bacterium]MCY4268277.1 hypothetical protein [Flavobacteriaceae bacterium]MCY4298503.1 hypothetical protein [Flavobacteriaceae bacterium]